MTRVGSAGGISEQRWSTWRTPASVKVLIDLGAEHGLDASACLRDTGLRPDDLADADALVQAGQELSVVRNLVRALPDVPGLGLEAGTRYHLTTHGIWGLALASSPNLRSAIRFGLRYLDLTFAFTRITLRERGGEACILLDDSAIPGERDVRRFLVEREGASIMTLQREMVSAAIPLTRLEAGFPEPPYADLYEPVFGLRPRFGASANVAAFDTALLDLPLPQANELTAKACEEQCRELLARRRTRGGIAGEVRARLMPRRGALPRIEEVARELHTSPRTLRRRLTDEGVSFRSLVEEVTMSLAEEFLSTRALTVEDIAQRVGYAEAASFTRAFTRRRGMPPGEFRRRRRAEAAGSEAALHDTGK
jgi:AraC-like DNA-binding protein